MLRLRLKCGNPVTVGRRCLSSDTPACARHFDVPTSSPQTKPDDCGKETSFKRHRSSSTSKTVFFFFFHNVALRPLRPYRLLGTGSPGRPPRLSHSSWAVRGTDSRVNIVLNVHTALAGGICYLTVHRSARKARVSRGWRFTTSQRILRVDDVTSGCAGLTPCSVCV